MPRITLNKGSATGPEVTFNMGFINLDDLTAGTEYELSYVSDITLGIGGTLHCGQILLNASGYEYLDLSSASDLIEPQRWYHDTLSSPDRYLPGGTYAPLTIGEQPDDWELRWRDKYYTQATFSQGGSDVITYQHVTSTFNPLTQYYENETAAALYFTPNQGCFGIWQVYNCTSATKTYSLAVGSDRAFGNSTAINNSAPACRLKSISGTAVSVPPNMTSINWRPFRTLSTAYNQTGAPKVRAVLVLVQLDGKNYPALAVVGYDAADAVAYVGMWFADSRFWTDDNIQPGTPGDWGANSSALKPSGTGTAAFVSVGINTSFPSALNAASYGGTAGGVHVWAMNDSEYAALNNYLWTESFVDRMMHLGRSPGDGIIGVHGMPEVTDYALNSSTMSLYGIKNIGLQAHLLSGRVKFKDCGSVTIPAIAGTYADYAAKVEIYLPFCGTYTLDAQKVMRGTLHLNYAFDRFTGDCLAQLSVSTAYPSGVDHPTGTTLILSAHGNAAIALPYAYTDGGVQGKLTALSGALTAGLSAASGSTGGILSGAMQIMQGLGQSQHISSSSATGNAGAMSQMTPFVWIEYPEPVKPTAYAQTVGHISATGGTVGAPVFDNIGEQVTYSGLQVYEAVDIQSITGATQEELQEIETLLKGGVFV